MKVISTTPSGRELLVTVKVKRMGRKPIFRRYRGSSTVWYLTAEGSSRADLKSLEEWERAPTFIDARMSTVCAQYRAEHP